MAAARTTVDVFDLCMTAEQTRQFVVPTAKEGRIGRLINEANITVASYSSQKRLGKHGELEGACREANAPRRLEALERRDQVQKSIQDLDARKKKVKSQNKEKME